MWTPAAKGCSSPGGASSHRAERKLSKPARCRLERQGPSPDADPSGAVATLSELVADFSRQLAQAIKETTRDRQAAPVAR